MIDRHLYKQALTIALEKARPAYKAAFSHKQPEKISKIPAIHIPNIPEISFPFSSK